MPTSGPALNEDRFELKGREVMIVAMALSHLMIRAPDFMRNDPKWPRIQRTVADIVARMGENWIDDMPPEVLAAFGEIERMARDKP